MISHIEHAHLLVLCQALRLLAELLATQVSAISLCSSFEGRMLCICSLLHERLVRLVLARPIRLQLLDLLPCSLGSQLRSNASTQCLLWTVIAVITAKLLLGTHRLPPVPEGLVPAVPRPLCRPGALRPGQHSVLYVCVRLHFQCAVLQDLQDAVVGEQQHMFL